MTSYMRLQTGAAWRRAALMTTLAVVAVACTPGEVLQVTDPDIINPSDVQSAAGANAVRIGARQAQLRDERRELEL